jgi:hypothetical protein
MLTSIVSFFKALAELLGLAKWFYNETRKTPAQKEDTIEEDNAKEKEQVETSGRPKWD